MKLNRVLKGTKAETLEFLSAQGYPVPSVYYFSVDEWNKNKDRIVFEIQSKFSKCDSLAVRSSAIAEDTEESSMAGAFHSLLNVKASEKIKIESAVEEVINSFDDNIRNQVLVQSMVIDVQMSGVIMSKVLDDGSPYYVINYDDKTGKTDSVTSGNSINKTVYIYNQAIESDFDSKLLYMVVKLVRSLEQIYPDTPLDIEFAIDKSAELFLLQVRKITTGRFWKQHINSLVSNRIDFLKEYVGSLMKPRNGLYGNKTLLGIMPDWNPAEMIGVVPHPLAMSLYRELITKRVWSLAREKMGYKKLPNVELMVSLYGRTYIDVRNSMNSFIPEGLNDNVADKLLNAYIERLDKNPHLHDKIEFDVVLTAYDFEFDSKFEERYEEVLNEFEFLHFKTKMKALTLNAIRMTKDNSLKIALADIEKLNQLQINDSNLNLTDAFSISDKISKMMGECIQYGTIPFSIAARHGFIAEILLRSLINKKCITQERISEFKRSVTTIAGEMSDDFYLVSIQKLSKEDFQQKYGHLRPSSYDILSPRYSDRKDLFDGTPQKSKDHSEFLFSKEEQSKIDLLLLQNGFDDVDAVSLFEYAKLAIQAREYAKYIFTKHLSDILELVVQWGNIHGFERQELSMLSISDVLDTLFAPLNSEASDVYREKIERAIERYDVASSFKLNYLIRSPRDISIVPMQRSFPNFIGSKSIEGDVVFLNPFTVHIPNLDGKIVCIEGADPGYDWIFSRKIDGLVTKYGGANSHMAIRCAELDIPAAIGCGEQPFERIIKAGKCLLDCQRKKLEPLILI